MVTIRYNVFRNVEREDLCCAVPEDRSVPVFVTDASWTFAGPLGESGFPLGFDQSAAADGARLNGFYVFQEARATARGADRPDPA